MVLTLPWPLKKTFWQWLNCTNLLWVGGQSFWQGFRCKSFWQGFRCKPAILLARIQSLSACRTRKSSTAFHRHPYLLSAQGWFSHLDMIGQGFKPSCWHSLQMDWLSSKTCPIPICLHQAPLPFGPQRDLVKWTPVKVKGILDYLNIFMYVCRNLHSLWIHSTGLSFCPFQNSRL